MLDRISHLLSDLRRQLARDVEVDVLLEQTVLITLLGSDLTLHLPLLVTHHFVLDLRNLVDKFFVCVSHFIVLSGHRKDVILSRAVVLFGDFAFFISLALFIHAIKVEPFVIVVLYIAAVLRKVLRHLQLCLLLFALNVLQVLVEFVVVELWFLFQIIITIVIGKPLQRGQLVAIIETITILSLCFLISIEFLLLLLLHYIWLRRKGFVLYFVDKQLADSVKDFLIGRLNL